MEVTRTWLALMNAVLTICSAFNTATDIKPVLVEAKAVGCAMDCRAQPDCKASINIDGVELVDGSHGLHVAVLQGRTALALKTGLFQTRTDETYLRDFFETIQVGDIILIVTERSCHARDWLSYFQTRAESWYIDVPKKNIRWVQGSFMILGICKGNCTKSSLGNGFPFVEVSREKNGPLKRSLKFHTDSTIVHPAVTASTTPDISPTSQVTMEIRQGHPMPLAVGVSTSLVAFALLILFALALRKISKTKNAGRAETSRKTLSIKTSNGCSSSEQNICEDTDVLDVTSDSFPCVLESSDRNR